MSAKPARIPNGGTAGDSLTVAEKTKLIEDIRRRLFQIVRETVEGLVEAGRLLRELDELGADTSDLRASWVYFVRKVAYDQLLPGLAVMYWDDKAMLRIVARLPIPQQQLLERGDGVEILIPMHGGQTNKLMVPLGALTKQQRKQAFARDHIRTESEQKAWLAADMAEAKHKPPERVGEWRLDFELNTAKHGNKTFALAELEAVIRAMRRGRRGAS